MTSEEISLRVWAWLAD